MYIELYIFMFLPLGAYFGLNLGAMAICKRVYINTLKIWLLSLGVVTFLLVFALFLLGAVFFSDVVGVFVRQKRESILFCERGAK